MNNNALTIWMPLYVGDYLRDTRHFTTQEHGAYMLLLMAHWVRGDIGLPACDKRLAQMVGCSKAQWKKLKPTLTPLFTITDERWTHPRLLIEIEKRVQKSNAARANAHKRWHGSKPNSTQPVSPNPQPNLWKENHNDTNPLPSAKPTGGGSLQKFTDAWAAGAREAVRRRARGV